MDENNINTGSDLSLDDIFSRLEPDKLSKKLSRQPFKFLDSYTKEDSDIFFGRDEETEDIYRKFYQSKLLLIYGRSGTGKSSVVGCGLLNKIPVEDIYTIKIRCGKEPYTQFISEIAKHSDLKSEKPVEILENVYDKNSKPILLLFDQFEEIFILSNEEKRNQLIIAIKQLLESRLKHNIIFVIREEYLANLTEFEKIIPNLFHNRMRIDRLHRSKASQIIENPCKVCGISIENGVSDLIINKLTDEQGTLELTYLQVIMDRMYKKAYTDDPDIVTILGKHFDELQSIGNVLTQYLDEQLHAMPNAREGEMVLKTLVSVDGTKRRMKVEDIVQNLKMMGVLIPEIELHEILQYFVHARIITDKDEHNEYELRHDSLAAKIYEKITLIERELMEVRQFIEQAWNTSIKRGILLSSADLDYIRSYESKLMLNQNENDFINKSKYQLLKSKRRSRNFAVGILSAIFIIMAIFTGWALSERTKALESEARVKQALEQVNAEKDKAEKALRKFEEEEIQRKKAQVSSLLQQAKSLMITEVYDLAYKKLNEASKIDSTNIEIKAQLNKIPEGFKK